MSNEAPVEAPLPSLHVYAQVSWHQDAWIVGTEGGLRALRDALDVALKEGSSSVVATAADGEGYHVLVLQTPQERFSTLLIPYRAFVGVDPDAEHPFEVLGPETYRKLTKAQP